MQLRRPRWNYLPVLIVMGVVLVSGSCSVTGETGAELAAGTATSEEESVTVPPARLTSPISVEPTFESEIDSEPDRVVVDIVEDEIDFSPEIVMTPDNISTIGSRSDGSEYASARDLWKAYTHAMYLAGLESHCEAFQEEDPDRSNRGRCVPSSSTGYVLDYERDRLVIYGPELDIDKTITELTSYNSICMPAGSIPDTPKEVLVGPNWIIETKLFYSRIESTLERVQPILGGELIIIGPEHYQSSYCESYQSWRETIKSARQYLMDSGMKYGDADDVLWELLFTPDDDLNINDGSRISVIRFNSETGVLSGTNLINEEPFQIDLSVYRTPGSD